MPYPKLEKKQLLKYMQCLIPNLIFPRHTAYRQKIFPEKLVIAAEISLIAIGLEAKYAIWGPKVQPMQLQKQLTFLVLMMK